MSSATATAGAGDSTSSAPTKKAGKKKLIMIVVPVVLIAAIAGLWFTGILPGLLGMNKAEKVAAGEHEGPAAAAGPTFVQLPEMVANLNAGARRTSFIKLQAKVELARPEDVAPFTAAEPRVLDLFQTYLREMRPEELRGSVGTYRLREQLIARATIAAAPARVVDVLFTELLVQ